MQVIFALGINEVIMEKVGEDSPCATCEHLMTTNSKAILSLNQLSKDNVILRYFCLKSNSELEKGNRFIAVGECSHHVKMK